MAKTAHTVIQEAKEVGVYLFSGGLDEDVEPVMLTGDRTVTNRTYPETKELNGFAVLDVPSREAALEWGVKIAAACRCAQEVPEFQSDPLA